MNDRRRELILLYAEGHAAIMAAVARAAPEALDRAPAGEWSVREVIHHLADTELFRSARLRRLLTQESPVIQAFDEERLHQLGYYERPAEASIAAFDAAVRSTLELLDLMSAQDWEKSGTHTEYGLFTMDMWLGRAADHLPDHAAQIRKSLAG